MNKLQQKIEIHLEKYKINTPKNIYLVAFSGGYDSMSLLDCLKKVAPDNRIIALHLNHNWRGAESDLEEIRCKEFCEKIGVEIYTEKLSQNVPHTETAGREARYDFFEKCSKKFNSRIIFTAHNKNDNAETLLYRICKGTGISGLQGIAENRGIYYRPLIEVTREEIETYCKDNHLTPNNDSSNHDIKYKRNFIRTEILPKLEKINPKILDTIETLSTVAKEETSIVEEYLQKILNKISKDNKIQTPEFLKQSNAIQKRIIYNIFIEHNLDYDRTKILKILDFVKENSKSKSGKTCSLTTNLWIFVNESIIEIVEKSKDIMPEIRIDKEGIYATDKYIFELQKCNSEVEEFPKDTKNIAYIDLTDTAIDFEIRTRKDGDIIYPFGLNGSQKLKKYLNSKKIPNHEKDSLLFLTKGKEILWAIGIGISDKIKVKTKPTHIIKFYKKEGK